LHKRADRVARAPDLARDLTLGQPGRHRLEDSALLGLQASNELGDLGRCDRVALAVTRVGCLGGRRVDPIERLRPSLPAQPVAPEVHDEAAEVRLRRPPARRHPLAGREEAQRRLGSEIVRRRRTARHPRGRGVREAQDLGRSDVRPGGAGERQQAEGAG